MSPHVQTNMDAAQTVAPGLSLGLLDMRVRRGDVRMIVLGFLATLVVALPIGYGTGFLVPPTVPGISVFDAFVNISKIVLFEEFLFRTLLFGALFNRLGLGPALLLSSVIFGLAHLIQFPWPMVVMAGWAGAVFAFQYAKTRRLSTPVLTHALVIIVQFFVLP